MLRESFVVDADAFLALRSLGILDDIRDRSELRGAFIMCQVAARQELSQVDGDVRALEATGLVSVHAVETRTPAHETYRRLKQQGVDKGEAEAIAWMLSRPKGERPILISVDAGARKAAGWTGRAPGAVQAGLA